MKRKSEFTVILLKTVFENGAIVVGYGLREKINFYAVEQLILIFH